jgi:hypothetical protein
MSPLVKRIQNDQELPAKADVVVIGGGIVGASAAFFLAERGLSVALVEKGHVGCEQSSRNWGWCRQQNRDARELPLSGVAFQLWDEFAGKIDEDTGFRRCGLLYATDNPEQLAEWEKWRDTARQFNVNTKMLNARQAEATIPANGRRWLGGVHSIDDGKAEPGHRQVGGGAGCLSSVGQVPYGTLPLSLIESSGLCQVDAEATAAVRFPRLMEPPALVPRRHSRASAVHSCRFFLASDNQTDPELTVLARYAMLENRIRLEHTIQLVAGVPLAVAQAQETMQLV